MKRKRARWRETRAPARRRVFLFLAATLALAGPVQARVYWLWGGGASHGAVSAGQPGWNLAYRAQLKLNAGGAQLEVLGVELRMDETLRQLERVYRGMGGKVLLAAGGELGWGVVVLGDRIVRLLVTAVAPGRECVVFRIEQTPADLAASLRSDGRRRLTQIPAYPESVPVLYAGNEDTRLGLEMSLSPVDPAGVEGWLRRAYAAEGWVSAFPEGASGGVALFRRGRDVSLARVMPGARGGARILLVHKRLGTGD